MVTGPAKGLWMSPGARISIVVLFALMLAIGAANILFTTAQVHEVQAQQAQLRAQQALLRAEEAQLRAQQLASCAFSADIGTLPLPDKPKPSRVGVSLLTDSRMEWHGDHCPGTLPMPPGLQKWAAYYHIPVS